MTAALRDRLLLPGAALGALAVAVALTLLDAPTAVRTLVVLPVVVGVTGAAALAAVLPRPAEVDRLTRVGMAVVLGLAALLASVLVVSAFGGPLEAGRLVIALLLLAAVALAVWFIRSRRQASAPASPLAGLDIRGLHATSLVSALAGVALVAAAFVVGRHVLPAAGAASPIFSFTGPAATQQGPTVAAPGRPVTLNWSLRHEDAGMPAGEPVQAVVDGRAVGVVSDVTPRGPAEWSGAAQLLAPTQVGVHRVVLSMPLPERRVELVTYLDVKG